MAALLQRFTNVRRDEVAPTITAGLFFFCILTALMVLRPARESLGMRSGLDAVRWLFIGTAVVTLSVNPVFGFLVSRYRRLSFISATYAGFAASLLLFYGLLVLAPRAVGEVSGMVFYVWFSVFNLFSTMVFWALMVDRFSLEQGKRLFGVIAVGGTVGAVFGPWLATQVIPRFGTPALLLVSTFFLGLGIAAAWVVSALQPQLGQSGAGGGGDTAQTVDDRAVIGGSAWRGFRAVLSSPYLLGISAYVLILTVISTFLYFTRLAMVQALGGDLDTSTGIFARIDLITQGTTLVLQFIVAGHLMKRVGVSVTLALLPITVMFGFVGLVTVGTLGALIAFEASFRAVQRAIMRPARETLFTVVSREDKYKSKAFVDTFVYRTGDVVGAWTDGLLGRLGMGLLALGSVAVPLAVVWAGLGIWLGRAQRDQARRVTAAPGPVPELGTAAGVPAAR